MLEPARFITLGPETQSPPNLNKTQQWKTLSILQNKSFLPQLNSNSLSLRQVRQQKHKIEDIVAQSVQRINFIKQDSIKSFQQALKVKQAMEKVYKSRDIKEKSFQRKILLNGMKVQHIEDMQQQVKDKKSQEKRDIEERRKIMVSKAKTIGQIVKKEQAESENIIGIRQNQLQELKKEQVDDVKHLHILGKEKISLFKSMRQKDIQKLKSKMLSHQLHYNQKLYSEKETLENQEKAIVELLHQSLALSHQTQQQLQKAKSENFDSQSSEIVKGISNHLSQQELPNRNKFFIYFNKGSSISSSITLI